MIRERMVVMTVRSSAATKTATSAAAEDRPPPPAAHGRIGVLGCTARPAVPSIGPALRISATRRTATLLTTALIAR